jgi:hypothetical protein
MGKHGKRPDSECNMRCRHDNSRWCGAGWRNNIFKLKIVKKEIVYNGTFGDAKGNMQNGYCVTALGRDQNSGVKKLNSLDINTDQRRLECLSLCEKVPNATGCEGIWSQGNRGCYAHTAEVSRGNGRARHVCWPKPLPPIKYNGTFGEMKGGMQNGYCVTALGRDQNSGVKKLNNLDINTDERRLRCLAMCEKVQGATGCEGIWSQGNRGCYAHTAEVSRGNGRARHSCWVEKKPALKDKETFGPAGGMQKGFCVTALGRDQNSGVKKLNNLDINTAARRLECLALCE